MLLTMITYIQVFGGRFMYGMVRNWERFALERWFLNNFGFLMDIKSCVREFHGLMTRDEKKCLDKLFLHNGISSFFEWPRSDVECEAVKKSSNWRAEWPCMILKQVERSVIRRLCSRVCKFKVERRWLYERLCIAGRSFVKARWTASMELIW